MNPASGAAHKSATLICFLGVSICAILRAQSPASPEPASPQVVPLSSEPSHHLVFENTYVRVFRVAVPPKESTLLHQHAQDYLYAVLGPAQITNGVAGKPETHLQFADAEVHFSPGPFAHIVHNELDTPFRNVTIELLHPQAAAHNLCGEVLPGDLGPCPEAQRPEAQLQSQNQSDKIKSEAPPKTPRAASPKSSKSSAVPSQDSPVHHSIQPWFATSELLVNFVRIDPAHGLHSTARFDRLLVVLEQAELEVTLPHKRPRQLHPGDVFWLPAEAETTFTNMAAAPSRFLLIYFKDTPPR